jgi:chromosome segregation and condensation protein ScpB
LGIGLAEELPVVTADCAATTEAFLQRFGLSSLQELTSASLSGNPAKKPASQPSV